jgi:integrase
MPRRKNENEVRLMPYRGGYCAYLDKKRIYLSADYAAALIRLGTILAERAGQETKSMGGSPLSAGGSSVKSMTLLGLCRAYWRWIREFQPGKTRTVKAALKHAEAVFGKDKRPVSEIGMPDLIRYRDHLIQCKQKNGKRLQRAYINKLVTVLKDVFREARKRGYIPASVLADMREVESLRRGEDGVMPDNPTTQAVPDADFLRTLPLVPPAYAAVLKILWITGMRPIELCRLTVGGFDKSDSECWTYHLTEHKTAGKGKQRFVGFGKTAQDILIPFLQGKSPSDFVFGKADIVRLRYGGGGRDERGLRPSEIKRRANRQASIEARAAGKPMTAAQINVTVAKALQKHGDIPHWAVYQLRKAAGTRARLKLGLGRGGRYLGHSDAAEKTLEQHYFSAEGLRAEIIADTKGLEEYHRQVLRQAGNGGDQ